VSLVVLLGGARSGKSRLAQELAGAAGWHVALIATAEALDDEMAARIAAHRAERPQAWVTVEESLELGRALGTVDPSWACIVDCLSLWVSNLLLRGDEPSAVEEAARRCAAQAAERPGLTVAVTNEVGLGVVPPSPLGRTYRDALGVVNRVWVDASERTAFVVAGRILPLESADGLIAQMRT
jgi:adenosyl cobinamide kinase/adenosyl cobinamide phosphate guanylyltransferase